VLACAEKGALVGSNVSVFRLFDGRVVREIVHGDASVRGMFTMLWQHEFYMVMEVTYGAYVYQALEFKVGSSLPPYDVIGSTAKDKNGVWVRGVAYAPSLHVRKFNKLEERKGYLFHTIDDEADGDVALYGKCPELVRVDNCTAWRPMSSVLSNIPRVVHPDDMKTRMIHVAGRALHEKESKCAIGLALNGVDSWMYEFCRGHCMY
jgi:hypothetical protein